MSKKVNLKELKKLAKEAGYVLWKVYAERKCSVYKNKICNCKRGQCNDLMY